MKNSLYFDKKDTEEDILNKAREFIEITKEKFLLALNNISYEKSIKNSYNYIKDLCEIIPYRSKDYKKIIITDLHNVLDYNILNFYKNEISYENSLIFVRRLTMLLKVCKEERVSLNIMTFIRPTICKMSAFLICKALLDVGIIQSFCMCLNRNPTLQKNTKGWCVKHFYLSKGKELIAAFDDREDNGKSFKLVKRNCFFHVKSKDEEMTKKMCNFISKKVRQNK